MTRLTIVAALAVLFAVSTLPAAASEAEEHEHGMAEHEHGHEHEHGTAGYSAGEPGNPEEPSRVVQVTMEERDGKMLFDPNHIEVRKGEQIKFLLYNSGELDHEFVLATAEENLEHAEAMKKNPEMEHHDPNARSLEPKQRDEIVWKFTKPGQFQYACLIPGHLEAGMFGTVDVK
jgi:uncharacterized cupredoxin-like copper-binding protein